MKLIVQVGSAAMYSEATWDKISSAFFLFQIPTELMN